MRIWTLSFLACAALVLLGALIGVDSTVQFVARVLFMAGILIAVFAGIRSVTLQMANVADLRAHCATRRDARADGRRCGDRELRMQAAPPSSAPPPPRRHDERRAVASLDVRTPRR